MSKLFAELNEVQGKAVSQSDGPVMIIAGAGSGKTRVLTYRIAHLIEKGVDPFNILALTFTNKAAREMRDRISGLIGSEARNLWMGTFHSVFAKILRIEAPRINYPSNFTIYDSDDSKSVIKSLVKEMSLNPDNYKPGMVMSRISLAKNSFVSPEQYLANRDVMADDHVSGRGKLGELYKNYCQRCFSAGAMDFDDLLLKTHLLFASHADVLYKYQQKFKYLMVDEYQDTNHLQYLIIRKLAAVTRNLCVVGDDAQSIYGFRGAEIQNILNFQKDYPDLKVFKLEQNYRSTGNIVEAAGSIIRYNKEQLDKNVWTANEHGHPIMVYKAPTDNDEGRFVATAIFEEKHNTRSLNKEFAILYRTNSQSRAFEEALRRLSIPFKIVGGQSFYQRKEIKDILAYFRMAVNPGDEEAFKRIINYPARGIGDTTVNRIISLARAEEVTLWQAARIAAERGLEGRVVKPLQDWVVMMENFQHQASAMSAFDAAYEIARNSGLSRVLHEDKTIEGIGRYENLQELMSALKEFSEAPERDDISLGAFMQEISLLTSEDQNKENSDVVTLMTIHQAKGLEFDYVFIVGLEENLFPSQMSLATRSELEEERRLFYVALTRARKKAWLTYAMTRFRWGQLVHAEVSRFIEEINPKYLEFMVPEEPVTPIASQPGRMGARLGREFERQTPYSSPGPVKPQPSKVPAYIPSADFAPEDVSHLEEGMQVEHNKFGMGKVVKIEGAADQRKASIFFKDIGEKQILLKFAKMRILK